MKERLSILQTPEFITPGEIQKLHEAALLHKIEYPDTFKPLNSQSQDLILAINEFNKPFLEAMGNAGVDLAKGGTIDTTMDFIEERKNPKYNLAFWQALVKAGIVKGEYSERIFYTTILSDLPKYFSSYGIFANSAPFTSKNEVEGNLVEKKEITFDLSQIDKVVREDIEQLGIKTRRNVLYGRNISSVNGVEIKGLHQEAATAKLGYGNIFVYMDRVNVEFEIRKKEFENFLPPPPGFVNMHQAELEAGNKWMNAASIAMARIFPKLSKIIKLEDFLSSTLAHETRHLVDNEQKLDLKQLSRMEVISQEASNERELNLRIHEELNPRIVELTDALGPYNLLRFISETKGDVEDMGAYFLAEKWILRRMIEIIAKNPDRFGVAIDEESKVSRLNQAMCQLDLLIDRPEHLRDLAQELIALHNSNLSEDIVAQKDLFFLTPKEAQETSTTETVLKFAIPATLAGLGLEALRRRKNRIAQANMSRPEIRRKKKKKEKGKNN